ncbi:MAG: hypothetical protein JHC95_17270, partial [Solirubrobacteraceae bacterium]|nr:hypothetical protein [Solirubrobacteraceae bacterium]
MIAPLELAERALHHTDGDALVRVVAERSLSSRFARSAPTQATAVDDLDVEVLVVREGQVGLATTNRIDEDGLRDAARRAARAADLARAAGPGAHPGLPDPAEAVGAKEVADPPELDPALAGGAIQAAIAEAGEHGAEAFGIWSAGVVTHAVASSAGARLSERATDGYMKVICRDARERSGFAAATTSAPGSLDGAALARAATAKLIPGEPVALEPGAYTAVLDADAVGDLLQFAGLIAFNGLLHAEGRGALVDRLGTGVASSVITLSDAPGDARTLPRAFDAEGVAKRTRPLIRAGVAQQVVHDSRSAALAGGGAVSTGHALSPGGGADGPEPTNLILEPGNARDVTELCAPIERGIYVTRLWYTNTVREHEALVTSMTRDGTFLIEDGQITRPAADVRITDSLLRILSATEDLGAEGRLIGHGEFYGRRFAHGVHCPP